MDYVLSLLREPAAWVVLVVIGAGLTISGSPALMGRLKDYLVSREPSLDPGPSPDPAPVSPNVSPTGVRQKLPSPIVATPAHFEPYDTALRLRRWLLDNGKTEALKAFDLSIWPSLLPSLLPSDAPAVSVTITPADPKKGTA